MIWQEITVLPLASISPSALNYPRKPRKFTICNTEKSAWNCYVSVTVRACEASPFVIYLPDIWRLQRFSVVTDAPDPTLSAVGDIVRRCQHLNTQ